MKKQILFFPDRWTADGADGTACKDQWQPEPIQKAGKGTSSKLQDIFKKSNYKDWFNKTIYKNGIFLQNFLGLVLAGIQL